jgi:hypothetical protein
VREGLHYNPYFPGGAIAMPKMLSDGGVEYDDGTPATEAQQAKVGGGDLWRRRRGVGGEGGREVPRGDGRRSRAALCSSRALAHTCTGSLAWTTPSYHSGPLRWCHPGLHVGLCSILCRTAPCTVAGRGHLPLLGR